MDANLVKRIAFAAIAIPLALLVVWQGGVALALVVAVAAALGIRELFAFAERQGIRPLGGFGAASAAALPVATWLAVTSQPWLRDSALYLGALWGVLLLAWTLFARRPDQRPLGAASVTALGVLYTAALPSYLLVIRHAEHPLRSWAGAWLVFTPLVVTWVCDTAAMFGGRAMGGPKLWKAVSPGKTWSGSLAGVVGGIVTVPVLDAVVLERLGVALPLAQGLLFGAVLSVVGQVGDLAESNFKREVGVKDSSHLIPGHGGVLDRFDSLYFVLPVAAVLYKLFGAI